MQSEYVKRNDIKESLTTVDAIILENKFNLNEMVYVINRCDSNLNNRYRMWHVENMSYKILAIIPKIDNGGINIRYRVQANKKVREENIFTDYESAVAECRKRNCRCVTGSKNGKR